MHKTSTIALAILFISLLNLGIIIEKNSVNNNNEVPFYVSWIIHVHQPYYNVNGSLTQLLSSPDKPDWLDNVWISRSDIYKYYIPWTALNMSGDEALQVDITGTLINQLNELEESQWHNCLYCGWKKYWLKAVDEKTASGYPRLRILGTGYYHPIFPLIMRSGLREDFTEQVMKHRELVKKVFGVNTDKGFFPIEESFTPEMIPLLEKMGFEWTIVDSEQLLRATKGYNSPYDPKPNQYDVRNPDPGDWEWSISPQLVFRPHVVEYNGSKIVVFIRYRHMSQAEMSGTDVNYLIQQIKHFQTYNTDPNRPFIMVIVHDGENGFPYQEWGGSHGYQYYVNYLVEFIKKIRSDPSLSFIKIIGLTEYLEKIYDPRNDTEYTYSKVWVEPGSWETMGTWGDPNFAMWNYPDINSPDQTRWGKYIEAVNYYLTANNSVNNPSLYRDELEKALDWIMRGETSCYYYWDGSEWWDVKALKAFQYSITMSNEILSHSNWEDNTPPTIRWGWRDPYNPGSSVNIYIQAYDLNGISVFKAYIYRSEELIAIKDLMALNTNNFYKLSVTFNESGIYRIVLKASDRVGNTIVYRYITPFYASASTTQTPTSQEPFTMDGNPDTSKPIYIDENNTYIKELWIGVRDKYLYVASNTIPSNTDLFIFISLDPFQGYINPPWLKNGSVAKYQVYLGVEGSNRWSGWYSYGDHIIEQNCGSIVSNYVEGYIDLTIFTALNIEKIYVAVAVYETLDKGSLLEVLYNDNHDWKIDPQEYLEINISSIELTETPINQSNTLSNTHHITQSNTESIQYPQPPSSHQTITNNTTSKEKMSNTSNTSISRNGGNEITAYVLVYIIITSIIIVVLARMLKKTPE